MGWGRGGADLYHREPFLREGSPLRTFCQPVAVLGEAEPRALWGRWLWPPGWLSREETPVSPWLPMLTAAGGGQHQPRSHLGRREASDCTSLEPEHSTRTKPILGTPCVRKGASSAPPAFSVMGKLAERVSLLHILKWRQRRDIVTFTSD